jgi:Zn-dependent peptidase ImmA (M78 family)
MKENHLTHYFKITDLLNKEAQNYLEKNQEWQPRLFLKYLEDKFKITIRLGDFKKYSEAQMEKELKDFCKLNGLNLSSKEIQYGKNYILSDSFNKQEHLVISLYRKVPSRIKHNYSYKLYLFPNNKNYILRNLLILFLKEKGWKFQGYNTNIIGYTNEKDGKNIIYIDKSLSKITTNFTLAHELAHVLWQKSYGNIISNLEIKEKIIDKTSAYILLPDCVFLRTFGNNKIKNPQELLTKIAEINKSWNIPIYSICKRIKENYVHLDNLSSILRNTVLTYETFNNGQLCIKWYIVFIPEFTKRKSKEEISNMDIITEKILVENKILLKIKRFESSKTNT